MNTDSQKLLQHIRKSIHGNKIVDVGVFCKSFLTICRKNDEFVSFRIKMDGAENQRYADIKCCRIISRGNMWCQTVMPLAR